MNIGPHIKIDRESNVACCAECDCEFGPVTENLKQALLIAERDIAAAGPYYDDPSRFVSDELVFREYYCPQCGIRQFVQVARPEEGHLSEVELSFES